MKNVWTKKMIEMLMDLYEDHTYLQISEIINKKFKTDFSENAVRKAFERNRYPVIDLKKRADAPRILLLDIETAPMLGYVWGLWDNNVGLNQLKSDWHVLSWSAKWYDSEEVMYEDQRNEPNIENDKKILKMIWKLLDEADIVITQNGKSFDIPKLYARFLLNGLKPPSSFRNIDTLLIARRHFKMTSNKLEYMTDKLCTKYKKLKHKQFPGFSLWSECLKGNKEAWIEMEEYNKYDVLSLEELYEILIPWDDSINYSIYFQEDVCSCGGTEFVKNGFYYTNSNKYQKYKCGNCSKEYRDRKRIRIEKNLRMTNKRG